LKLNEIIKMKRLYICDTWPLSFVHAAAWNWNARIRRYVLEI
jgi:hypothetical protein